MLFAEKPVIFNSIRELLGLRRSGNTGDRILSVSWAQSSMTFFFF